MTRLSREQKRELKRAGRAPARPTPIDVRVSAETGATVGGMPVPPAAGESLQSAALGYLHRLALATGHPVLATVHDERIGYVVPLQIHVDGSSAYAGEPVRVAEPRGFGTEGDPVSGTAASAPLGQEATPWTAPEPQAPAQGPRRDRSTHVLRSVPESAAAEPQLPSAQGQSSTPAGPTAPHAQPERRWEPQAGPDREPRLSAQAQTEWQPEPDARPQAAQDERQPPSDRQRQPQAERQPSPDGQAQAEWQAQLDAQVQAGWQPQSGERSQGEAARQPQVVPRVRPDGQPQAKWQAESDARPQVQAQAQAQDQPQWQPQAEPEPSGRAERQAESQGRPDVRPEAPARSPGQPKPEPSTMRLAAGKQAPSAEPAVPERPKREPSTLPLSAAKPAPASAPVPPHAPEATAPEATPEQSPAEPVAEAAPGVKREPRTMPLTAAKEKQAQRQKQEQDQHPEQNPEQSAAAPGKVAPSTFVLRAVPEPTEGPLAQPPRTPGLPLTLAGHPIDPEGDPAAPEPIRDAMPEPTRDATPEPTRDAVPTGTVSPPTGEFGPVTAPEPSTPQARTTPQPWHPEQPTTPPQTPPHTPGSAPDSLEPQPWPPAQSPAPVRDFTRAPAAEPTAGPEPEPASPEPNPQPWSPSRPPAPAPDALASPETRHATPTPQPWPPAPADEPTPEPAHEPSSPSDSGPASLEPQPWPPTPPPMPAHAPAPAPDPAPFAPAPPEESATDAYSAPEWTVLEEDNAPKPAPVREFDAVAESVLDTAEEDGGTPSPFAESVSRINEAVKMGRIQDAAEMAEQTVAQATAALGPQHPEVLKLRELTAYIAYLAGDALRSFHLSLDLAGLRHRMRDQRAAYGNIQSAAAAWRAVRDPLQGLHLGRDLIAVWSDLANDAGPAAEDVEQLEKARTRMTRLTERARALDSTPYAHGQ